MNKFQKARLLRKESELYKIPQIPHILPYTGKKIKTFIVSFNRLTFLQQQIEFLKRNPYLDLHIIDNGSTYPPLLKYLNELDCKVTFVKNNEGHTVIWKNNISKEFCLNEPYIVTDNDIIPDYEKFHEVLIHALDKYPKVNKIGLGLRIHDLPMDISLRKEIIQYEIGFHKNYTEDYQFLRQPVDTTMALYRAGYHNYSVWGYDHLQQNDECKSLRTANPLCQAKHLSWYLTREDLQSEENKYYFNSILKTSTHWSSKQAALPAPININNTEKIKLNFNCFDGIYCINLEERKDRLEKVSAEFESVGIGERVIRFEAIKNDIGWKGALDSHIEIIRQAKDKKLKNVLVFEDDVTFIDMDTVYFDNLINSIKALESFHLLYLSANTLAPLIRKNEFLFTAQQCLSTHAICYNYSIYDKILDDYDKNKYGLRMIDMYLMNNIQTLNKSYIASKCCVTQRNDYSSIEKKHVNYDFIVNSFNKNTIDSKII